MKDFHEEFISLLEDISDRIGFNFNTGEGIWDYALTHDDFLEIARMAFERGYRSVSEAKVPEFEAEINKQEAVARTPSAVQSEITCLFLAGLQLGLADGVRRAFGF